MTLTDLYNRLDWSHVKANPDRWFRLYTEVEGKPLVDEDYFRRFWCTVLNEAINGTKRPLKETAIQLLYRIQMWNAVVSELKKEGLIEDERAACETNTPDAKIEGNSKEENGDRNGNGRVKF